jgi:hypothetical protein
MVQVPVATPDAAEDVARALRERARTGTPVYYTSDALPPERALAFADDFDRFLALAGRLDATPLYAREVRLPADDRVMPEVAGQVRRIDVAFHHDGLLHVFTRIAPWAADYPAAQREAEQQALEREVARVAKGLRDCGEAIVTDFVGEARRGAEPLDLAGPRLRRRFLAFLDGKLDLPPGHGTAELVRQDEGFAALVEAALRASREGMERAEERSVAELAAPCAAWAAEQGLRTVTQAKVDAFLAARGQPLSAQGRRALRERVHAARKAAKG